MSRKAKLSKQGKPHTRVQRSNRRVSAAKPDGSVNAKGKRLLTRGTATADIFFSKNPVPLSEWMKGIDSAD